MSQEEIQSLAREIAQTLGETEKKPFAQIKAILENCGVEFAQSILAETQAIEAGGGMLLKDQSRRRTAGGIFFKLARKKMSKELAKVIFPPYFGNRPKSDVQRKVAQPQPPPLPVFEWPDRETVIQSLLNDKGALTTVKVTLIGRPGKIDTSHKDVVITTMTHIAKSAAFPKGIPKPPEEPTLYTVYISAKQWQKVKDTIQNPDDALIIEGTCAYDDKIGAIAVFTMNLSSKLLESQKRQAQKESSGTSENDTGKVTSAQPGNPRPVPPAASAKPKPQKEFDTTATRSLPAVPDLPNAPRDVIENLTKLYASASLFRQKIATIQSKPPGQQFGLEMTQKLLKNVEDDIEAVEKKYRDDK